MKSYIVGTHWKSLSESLLMSTHNIIMFLLRNKKKNDLTTLLSSAM